MKGQLLDTVHGSNGNTYEIRLGKDDVMYCTCPRWRFKKSCKHLDMYMLKHKEEPLPKEKSSIENAIAEALCILR